MPDTYWAEILKTEDRIISNSDRKHRYHFKSLEAMSEELVRRESIAHWYENDFAEDMPCGSFLDRVKNEKLANALRRLTKKQLQVIELAFWDGYTQAEIADIIGCTQSSVAERLSNALMRLERHLNNR